MSLENAILELSASIRYHADALAQMALAGGAMTGREAKYPLEHKPLTTEPRTKEPAQPIKTGDAEIEQAVEKVEAAAKEEKAAPTKTEVIAQANADAKAAKEKAVEPKAEEPAPAAEAIDYKTQVYPKLVELGKGKGRAAVVGLLAEFDAKNGDQLKPEQYSAVLARAAELAA